MAIKDLRVEIEPRLRSLDVYARREVLSKTIEGEIATAFKGRGVEFSGFRQYQAEDDANRIDWKASLRSGDILIREFEEYKNTVVYFLLDVSDSMLFSSNEKLKCEYAAELLYMLADAFSKAGDAVGMGMFNEDIITSVDPGTGSKVLNRMKGNLLDGNIYGGGFNLEKTLLKTKSKLSDRAVVIILSDFLGMKEGWEKYIKMFTHGFEIIGISIKDERDLELPKMQGRFLLKDPYTENNIYIDAKKHREEYKKKNEEELEYMNSVFKQARGDFTLLRTDMEPTDKLIKFFSMRHKRSDM